MDVNYFAEEEKLNELNPQGLTTLYLKWRSTFYDLTKRADRISRGSGGIYVEGNRLAYASVLFTRLCVMAKSIGIFCRIANRGRTGILVQ